MYRDTGYFSEVEYQIEDRERISAMNKMAIIDQVWEETWLGARLLFFYELKRRGYTIPHNKIHQHLRETGRTTPNPGKQKKRKRCRYEKKYSGSLIHGDWHRTTEIHLYAIVWLYDASRMALAGGECERANHVESIDTIKEAQGKAYDVWIREVNTEREIQDFIPTRTREPRSSSITWKERGSSIFHQETGTYSSKWYGRAFVVWIWSTQMEIWVYQSFLKVV